MRRLLAPPQGVIETYKSGLTLQLFLSHALAGGCAVVVFSALAHTRLSQINQITLIMLAAGLSGLLLTSNIQYNLYVLTLTLARFAQGLPAEVQLISWRWPLMILFTHCQALSGRLKEYSRQTHLANELREQALHQASEAAAQAERNRIARELHDSIKQQIFSISMSAAAAKAHWNGNSQDAQDAVADILRSTKEAQVEMRALLQQLGPAPLENTSLAEALRTQAEALGFRTGAHITVDLGEMPSSDQFLPGTQETIFRIVQEAFANIARHARASNVWLKLQQQDRAISVQIRDDGQGFEPSSTRPGMGLKNIRERVTPFSGSVEVESAPGKGTTLTISIPLLEKLQTAHEEEQNTFETRKAIEQTVWGIQLGENAIPIAFMLFALSITVTFLPRLPSPSNILAGTEIGVFTCLMTALYACIQAHTSLTRVRVNLGSNNVETLNLQRRKYRLYNRFLRLSIVCIWYFFLYEKLWLISPFSWWILFGISIILGILLIAVIIIYRRIVNRYYGQLSQSELDWNLARRRDEIRKHWRTLVIIGAIFFLLNSDSLLSSSGTRNVGTNIGAALLIIYAISNLTSHFQIKHWNDLRSRKS
ncbi:sensor histidine kinase [Ktedonosporobacter rubrisoli]|nr:sensor histidine kinase [Ktedonosporobacter rubrisoli]